MDQEFIPYIQAVELKNLGFDEVCFGRYQTDAGFIIAHTEKYVTSDGVDRKCFFTLAPLWQQVFKWFRKEYKIVSSIDIADEGTVKEHYFYTITTVGSYGYFKTYEEAELACLNKLIEIVKKQK